MNITKILAKINQSKVNFGRLYMLRLDEMTLTVASLELLLYPYEPHNILYLFLLYAKGTGT